MAQLLPESHEGELLSVTVLLFPEESDAVGPVVASSVQSAKGPVLVVGVVGALTVMLR